MNLSITDAQMAADEELCQKATPGPWEAKTQTSYAPEIRMTGEEFWVLDGHSVQVWQCDDPQDGCMEIAQEWADTARFITRARTALPQYIQALREARVQNAKLLKVAEAAEWFRMSGVMADACPIDDDCYQTCRSNEHDDKKRLYEALVDLAREEP